MFCELQGIVHSLLYIIIIVVNDLVHLDFVVAMLQARCWSSSAED